MKKKTDSPVSPVLPEYVPFRNIPKDNESLSVVFPNTTVYEVGKPLCDFFDGFTDDAVEKIKSFLQGKTQYTHYFLRMLGNNSEIVIEVR